MALSKLYTLQKFRSLILVWFRNEFGDKLEPNFLDDLINLGVLKVFELLGGAILPDYGKKQALTMVLGSAGSLSGSPTSGTITTKTVTSTAHGLSVGDNLLLYTTSDNVLAYDTVASVTDANTFVLTSYSDGVGGDTIKYFKVVPAGDDSADISSYNIDKISRIDCSNNGNIFKVRDEEYQIFKDLALKQNGTFWYQHGETLYFYKGSAAQAWGTVTMHYYGYPAVPSADINYIDLRDKYIPLLIDVVKAKVYEHLKIEAPEALAGAISAEVQRFTNAETSKDTKKEAKTGAK